MNKLNFSKQTGLIPVVIQDINSKRVYMVGYMNHKSLAKTKETGYVWFWSRSRKTLWMKGETSGNTLKVHSIATDCDYDSLLIQVHLTGTFVCHTGAVSCFFNTLQSY